MGAVLITRPQPAADQLAARLKRAGIEAYVAPLMKYETLPNDVSIAATCDTLAFTSVQGVVEFAAKSDIRDKQVFAVGETTGAAANEARFKNIQCAAGGAAELAAMMAARTGIDRPRRVFHASGEQVAEELKAFLPSDMAVIRVPVYRAALIHSIPHDAEEAILSGRITRVALFSPRMAAHFVQIMQRRHYKQAYRHMEAVCFSEKVALALGETPFHKIHVAVRPDIDAMMDILTRPPPVTEKQEAELIPAPHDPIYNLRDPEDIDEVILHERRQQHKIEKEKSYFIWRFIVSACIVIAIIIAGGIFLLAPEYFSWMKPEKNPPLVQVRKALPLVQKPAPGSSFGASLSSGIETVQNVGTTVTDAVLSAADTAKRAPEVLSSAAQTETAESIRHMMQMLAGWRAINSSAAGRQVMAQAMAELKKALAQAPADMKSVSTAVTTAKDNNRFLGTLFSTIAPKDLGAAALLLTTVELRSKIGDGRPFEDDLKILQKFAEDDPEMLAALTRLAPYAKTGVLSRATLTQEFEATAADIVMAKVRGEDITVKQRIMNRLSRLIKVRRSEVGDINGPQTEAAVARAQLLLNAGDIKGAMRELQGLDAVETKAAEEWYGQAAATAAAEDSTMTLIQSILKNIPKSGNSGTVSLQSLIPDSLQQILTPPAGYGSPSLNTGEYPLGGGVVSPAPPQPFPLAQ